MANQVANQVANQDKLGVLEGHWREPVGLETSSFPLTDVSQELASLWVSSLEIMW